MKCSKCDGKVVAKGLCMTHYQAERRTMLKPVRVEATERTLMAALLVGEDIGDFVRQAVKDRVDAIVRKRLA